MNQESEPLTIDIVSDVVCPWCYLGEKRLEAALAEEPQPVQVRWRPYQLDPIDFPTGTSTCAPNTGRRNSAGTGGSRPPTKAQRASMPKSASPTPSTRSKRSPNTLDAHRLIRWALSAGVQARVADRLFEGSISWRDATSATAAC